jgi:hypothetical protein
MYKSSFFRSVNIADYRIQLDSTEPLTEGPFGFVLVDDVFVPYEFINKIKAHLSKQPKQYETVMDAECFVDYEFWQSLDDYERKLVGPCLLILMEYGDIYLREGSSPIFPPVIAARSS